MRTTFTQFARVRTVFALGVVVATACSAQSSPPPDDGYVPADATRAFRADSWWNVPVPRTAPSHPRAAEILHYMRTEREAGGGCVRLAGADGSEWGQPVYWSEPGDTVYHVDVDMANPPPELATLRIPSKARPAATNDEAMTVFDLDAGYVVAFTDARYDAGSDSWSANGATVTYLASSGLHADTGESDEPRNLGNHRGNNGATMMVRYDLVRAGAIDHVLKVASGPEVGDRAVFPMINSDGSSDDPDAPAQGVRFRIKPGVDLDDYDLAPDARVIAEALQRYGFYIGDSAGVTALKLENTRAEGRGQLWDLTPTALCGLPLDAGLWDVLPEGYDPSDPVD